jgi:hypothetical protein
MIKKKQRMGMSRRVKDIDEERHKIEWVRENEG